MVLLGAYVQKAYAIFNLENEIRNNTDGDLDSKDAVLFKLEQIVDNRNEKYSILHERRHEKFDKIRGGLKQLLQTKDHDGRTGSVKKLAGMIENYKNMDITSSLDESRKSQYR